MNVNHESRCVFIVVKYNKLARLLLICSTDELLRFSITTIAVYCPILCALSLSYVLPFCHAVFRQELYFLWLYWWWNSGYIGCRKLIFLSQFMLCVAWTFFLFDLALESGDLSPRCATLAHWQLSLTSTYIRQPALTDMIMMVCEFLESLIFLLGNIEFKSYREDPCIKGNERNKTQLSFSAFRHRLVEKILLSVYTTMRFHLKLYVLKLIALG